MLVRLLSLAVILLALGVGVAAPAFAVGAKSTEPHLSEYLNARLDYERAIKRSLHNTDASALSVAERLGRQCRGEMRLAPRDESFGVLNSEALLAPAVAVWQSERSEIMRFANAIRRSNTRSDAGRLAMALDRELLAKSSTAAPHPCSDIKAWVASGYRVVPQRAVRFVKAVGLVVTISDRELARLISRGQESKPSRCVRMASGRIVCSAPQAIKHAGTPIDRRLAEANTAQEAILKVLAGPGGGDAWRLARQIEALEAETMRAQAEAYSRATSRMTNAIGLDRQLQQSMTALP